jgi:DNA-binding MarR family transcriptional regulator
VPPDLSVADLEALVLRLGSVTSFRDGLSRTAAATLSRLATSGAARLTDLAVAEGVSQPSMSSLIARLVDQGLARREPDPDDARAVRLSLTLAGTALVASVSPSGRGDSTPPSPACPPTTSPASPTPSPL